MGTVTVGLVHVCFRGGAAMNLAVQHNLSAARLIPPAARQAARSSSSPVKLIPPPHPTPTLLLRGALPHSPGAPTPPLVPLLFGAGIFLLALSAVMVWLHFRMRKPAAVDFTSGEHPRVPLPQVEKMVVQMREQREELDQLRRQVRAAGNDSRRSAQLLLNAFPEALVLFDRNGIVQELNESARDLLGFASPRGLRAEELLREAAVVDQDASQPPFAFETIYAALQSGFGGEQLFIDYADPAGRSTRLQIHLFPLLQLDSSGVEVVVEGLIARLSAATGQNG